MIIGKNIACIGSRSLTKDQLDHCFHLGKSLAILGYNLLSGNADGADYAFQSGANTIDPKLVKLHLPWGTYNKQNIVDGNEVQVYSDLNFKYYCKQWSDAKLFGDLNSMTQGVQKMMGRNISIIDSCDTVIAWPGETNGTKVGIKYTKYIGKFVIDISDEEKLKMLKESLV